jgi:SARP family transcriptional regulator, regulator of embCAB operon
VSAWRFLVLGPLEVRHHGEPIPLGGPKQRTVLAALLLDAGRLVPAQRLVEHVWGTDTADGSSSALQVYVSNLRKALRDADPAAGDRIEWVRPGYRIEVAPDELDLHQVDDVLARARVLREEGELPAASHLLRFGLSLWRGAALADLADLPSVQPLVLPVERRHGVLRHECYDVELELGRHLALVPELEDAVAEQPLDERLAGQLVLALYRSGRQADALAVYRVTADLLRDELGLEVGQALRSLHESVLRHDPGLDRLTGDIDVAATMTQDDRGVRGATLTLPNGVVLELGSRTWVIGRHPDCDVVLADPEVSRRHAELRPVVGGYDLVDLGSSNGTRVGADEITRRPLRDGDVVTVGSTDLLVRVPV